MIDAVGSAEIGLPVHGRSPKHDESDETLLLRYRTSGDRQAFDQLVHRYEREIYSYLRRYLGDAQMAEDAFQGTFLQVHLKCDQFQKDRLFRPWLYAISTHQAIDLQRKNKRHRMVSLDNDTRGDEERVAALVDLLESRETPPLAGLETAERTQWVRKTVDALPETLRSTLVLVYYQGLKYREAAEVLSIPVGTVKSRLHTAILKLNQAWQSSGPQP
jgi:RNA polymerase sigma-70 factor (ECF subfamily)